MTRIELKQNDNDIAFTEDLTTHLKSMIFFTSITIINIVL